MQKFSGSSVPAEEHPIEPTPPAATVTGFNIPNINYVGSEPSQEDPSNMTASEEPTEQKGAIIFED